MYRLEKKSVVITNNLQRPQTRHAQLNPRALSTNGTAVAKRNIRECQIVLPFSKLNKMFFGYFDPENIFLDYENS